MAVGTTTGPAVRVALVQGGGPRGLRAVTGGDAGVYDRHLTASAGVQPPVDLVLWPEDVADIDGPLAGSVVESQLGSVASTLRTTLVAGVVEESGARRFRNQAVAWGPQGAVVARYLKAHRVPFGEYVPGRQVVSHLADLTLVPRDAIAGHRPGLLATPAGPMGVVISYEVFFADRARAAVRAGGELLLVPTNAASYRTSQVPTQEVAAARLRALETGRDVVQAAPTGYSAVVDAHGRLRARTLLGRQEVVRAVVHRRRGRTPYVRFGDTPVLAVAALALAAAWVAERRPSAPDQERAAAVKLTSENPAHLPPM